MSKTIKMVTVVDGEPTTVGRCHPGQARILQKQGLAEWKEGKLWFKTPFPAVPANIENNVEVSQTRDIEQVKDKDGNVVALKPGPTETTVKWKDHAPVSWCDWMRGEGRSLLEQEMEEIDPEGLVQGTDREYPEHATCVSLGEWFKQIVERRKLGHELGVADDPRSRMLGFIDVDDNIVFELGLSALKRATDEDYEVMGNPEEVREWMKSAEGRCRIVGDDMMMGCFNRTSDEDENEDVPEDLWESPPPHPLVTKDPSSLHVRRMLPRITDWGTFQWPEDREVVALTTKKGGEAKAPKGAFMWGYFRRSYLCLARIWKVGPKYVLEIGKWDGKADIPGYHITVTGTYEGERAVDGAVRRAMLYFQEVSEAALHVTEESETATPAS